MPSGRRCCVLLSIGVALVAAWALPADASSASTTIPDLASMVLQPSNLLQSHSDLLQSTKE
jgi:hypothetical protein